VAVTENSRMECETMSKSTWVAWRTCKKYAGVKCDGEDCLHMKASDPNFNMECYEPDEGVEDGQA